MNALPGMALQASITAALFAFRFPDSFGRQLICGMLFLVGYAALRSWKSQTPSPRGAATLGSTEP
jgi:hypothetical protein